VIEADFCFPSEARFDEVRNLGETKGRTFVLRGKPTKIIALFAFMQLQQDEGLTPHMPPLPGPTRTASPRRRAATDTNAAQTPAPCSSHGRPDRTDHNPNHPQHQRMPHRPIRRQPRRDVTPRNADDDPIRRGESKQRIRHRLSPRRKNARRMQHDINDAGDDEDEQQSGYGPDGAEGTVAFRFGHGEGITSRSRWSAFTVGSRKNQGVTPSINQRTRDEVKRSPAR
jgi:hypothetical protein